MPPVSVRLGRALHESCANMPYTFIPPGSVLGASSTYLPDSSSTAWLFTLATRPVSTA